VFQNNMTCELRYHVSGSRRNCQKSALGKPRPYIVLNGGTKDTKESKTRVRSALCFRDCAVVVPANGLALCNASVPQ
jgi:hypothetical protein